MTLFGRLGLWALMAALTAAAQTVEFNRDVRPILSDKCFLCHGPDAKTKNIPMRLDVEADAKADRGNGRRAIVEGNPEGSELMRRVTADKAGMRMPPSHTGLKLSEAEIQTIRTWIAQGAKWQQHWAFIPPARPALPPVKDAAWTRNGIDRFVLARLEREGLKPSPPAAKETLIRRVSLDLTGLGPTVAEVDAFITDKSPDAYEKVVDRLLASPRYGERMAARWLDGARYADTNGYQFDGERQMWRWRDWVIDSFNRNQPFDQFAIEQIAGDMLPNARRDQIIATGFNRNHRGNTEDGIIPEEYAVEYVVDRVETTSTVFLGLTMGCARCHNHKYDPFTQKEFYQFFAYFNNVPERGRAMKYGNSPPLIAAPTAEQELRHRHLSAEIAALERHIEERSRAFSRQRAEWERGLAAAPARYWAPSRGLDHAFPFDGEVGLKEVDGTVALRPGIRAQAAAFDGRVYLEATGAGRYDIDDPFTLTAWVFSESLPDGAVLARMSSDDQKARGYGVYVNSGRIHAHVTSAYADDALRIDTEETLTAGQWHHLAVTYDGSSHAVGLRIYLDGKPATLKVGIDTLYRPFRNAGRTFNAPFRIGGGAGAGRRFRGLIDDVRAYGRVLTSEEIGGLALPESINVLAAKPEAGRTAIERGALNAAFIETALASDVANLSSLLTEREKLERSFPTVMVMAERSTPRETNILIRGAYDKPGEKVDPAVPSVMPTLPAGAPNNRLGFAKWLASESNPLTARVTVNRFWQMYFGTGLVKTVEDFGTQGEWPSHPDLLDWLATEFVRTGWNVKALQKLIVTSATYRQSSRATRELIQRDPENRLLARGPRVRLPAEMIRDEALFGAGLLSKRIGGPSVKPYQPEGLWKETNMQDMDYVQSKGDELYRRSLYTFWKRTIAPPMMLNFDAAARESCVVRETRTNTPLQALNLMNDVTFLEAARLLGQRMILEGGAGTAERLRYGFRVVTSRKPTPQEEELLRGNLAFHLDYFATRPSSVKTFLAQGESPSDSAIEPRELAAYASVASLLLNLDEAVTKE